MQKEKYGFVYIWRDRKNNRYYIGSHWGTPDDGYICSSDWMRHAYKRRTSDFKRKIIARVYTNRANLLELEQKWLNLIKESELSKRYYNHNKNVLYNAWWMDPERAKTIKERMSEAIKKSHQRPEVREKLGAANKGRKQSEEEKQKRALSNRGKRRSDEFCKLMSDMHRGLKHSDESRQRMSIVKSGKLNPWFGTHGPMGGKTHSDESKRKMSESHRGFKRTFEHQRKLTESKIGCKRTPETCRRISESKKGQPSWNKGKTLSIEHRKKLSEAHLKRFSKSA